MCEKSEGSLGYEHLPGDRGFPENYLSKTNEETARESSVEYLQAVAKVRLYLSKAAELVFDLHEPTGKSQYSAGNAPWEVGWALWVLCWNWF